MPQQYGHAAAEAEGGGGEEGHTAGRDPQLEEADRAAAAAHAAEVAEYEHVPIGTANILVIEWTARDAGRQLSPLMSAATRIGFEVKTCIAMCDFMMVMWTLQRVGGDLSPELQHQLRKAIVLTERSLPNDPNLRISCN